MSVKYVELEQARAAEGLRMIVVGKVPSPWGEAAKGILHIKQLPWLAVRHDPSSAAQREWAGRADAPVLFFNDEAPRSGWAEILLLAERLAPKPSLIPSTAALRADMFGLCHEILGEQGLVWSRRLQLVHAGLNNDGGFSERAAKYLAPRYGYREDDAAGYGKRTAALIAMLSDRLKCQTQAGSDYLVGEALSAADIYSASAAALLSPLPPEQCDMHPGTRAAFETVTATTRLEVDPVLLEHRDRIYRSFLELPLSL